MFVMVLIVVLGSGVTSEQRLYPMPTRSSCETALKAALATWDSQAVQVVRAQCERMS